MTAARPKTKRTSLPNAGEARSRGLHVALRKVLTAMEWSHKVDVLQELEADKDWPDLDEKTREFFRQLAANYWGTPT